jgi:hypothetical protein
MKHLKILSILFAALFVVGCKTRQSASGYYTYETECLQKAYDGNLVVRSWGKALNNKAAENDAMRKALNDVIFSGIRNGKIDCNVIPVVTEANARINHEEYFNRFFSAKGIYRNFIDIEENRNWELKKRSDYTEVFPFVFRIKMNSLKKQLRTDQIL